MLVEEQCSQVEMMNLEMPFKKVVFEETRDKWSER